MVHRDIFGIMLSVAKFVDAVAELLIPAGFKPMVEETNIFEHTAADEQTTGRCEIMVCEVTLDRKTGVVIITGGNRGIVRKGELDITAHVVSITHFEFLESGVQPVMRYSHIGVNEGEDISLCVSDAGISGRIR
jgi:hypothetical protein